MLKGLRRIGAGLWVLRSLVKELREIRIALQALAAVHAPQPQAPLADPDLVVTYVDTDQVAEYVDIELRLTAARGLPPTEEEVLEEFERRHPPETGSPLGTLQ